jgi:hypothetical protein
MYTEEENGRLSGRLREQARSHSLIWVHLMEIGRLSGRHRRQASSHSLDGVHQ